MKKNIPNKITNFRRWLGYVFIISFSIYFLKIGIGNYLLQKIGTCKKAILTTKVNHFRSHKDALIYEFLINGKSYDGNSNIEDLSKAKDSICIVYLKWMPSINRPISFYDKGINCNCK